MGYDRAERADRTLLQLRHGRGVGFDNVVVVVVANAGRVSGMMEHAGRGAGVMNHVRRHVDRTVGRLIAVAFHVDRFVLVLR